MKHIPSLLSLVTLVTLTTGTAQAQNPWSTDQLSAARSGMGTATVGDVVFFGGGNAGNTFFGEVDIYDASTDTWTADALPTPRSTVGATALGDAVLFAGGMTAVGAVSDTVDVLDTQAMTWTTATLSQARAFIGATTVGTKAIFAGGGNIGSISDVVDIYDSSTGLWTATTLSQARAGVTAVTVGNLAIFAGGSGIQGVPYDTVDIYDESTGSWFVAQLSVARLLGSDAAAVVGSRAYFGGGHNSFQGGPNMIDAVDVFDASTLTWTVETLPTARGYVGATAVGNSILFAGGRLTGNTPTDIVDILDVGTGTWNSTRFLSDARAGTSATTVGGKALFAGGSGSGPMGGVPFATVDVYDPMGVNYCTATPNSTGFGATISVSGSRNVALNDLTLTVNDLPPGQFGFFLVSQTQGFITPLFSQGVVCLGGDIGRLDEPSQIIQGPQASLAIDLTSVPVNPIQAVLPGETWNFQCWHRDNNPGPTSNFTDAISVTFD